MANSKKVILLSDTHGHLHPQVLTLVRRADSVVHAGDIGHPAILAELAGDGRELVAVTGNNDVVNKWPARARRLLENLPRVAELQLPGGLVRVEHGDKANPVAKRHQILRDRHADARLIVYGHSHRQLIDAEQNPWVVNPGAAGRSRTYGGSGCVLLTIDGENWSLEAYQFPLIRSNS